MKIQGNPKALIAPALRNLVLLSALMIAGCGSGGDPWWGVTRTDLRSEGFLPFVSTLSGPVLAVDGEPVMITLQLSALLYPDLLRAPLPEDQKVRMNVYFLQANGNQITLVPFLQPYEEGNQPPQGPYFNEFSFDLREMYSPLQAGQTYTLRIASAASDANGGMPIVLDYNLTPIRFEAELPVDYKEISIEIQ